MTLITTARSKLSLVLFFPLGESEHEEDTWNHGCMCALFGTESLPWQREASWRWRGRLQTSKGNSSMISISVCFVKLGITLPQYSLGFRKLHCLLVHCWIYCKYVSTLHEEGHLPCIRMQNVFWAKRTILTLFALIVSCANSVLWETDCCQTLRKGFCPQANKIFFGARCPVPRWILNYNPCVCSTETKKNVMRIFQVALCHRAGEVPRRVQHRPHCHCGLRLDWA